MGPTCQCLQTFQKCHQAPANFSKTQSGPCKLLKKAIGSLPWPCASSRREGRRPAAMAPSWTSLPSRGGAWCSLPSRPAAMAPPWSFLPHGRQGAAPLTGDGRCGWAQKAGLRAWEVQARKLARQELKLELEPSHGGRPRELGPER